MHPAAAPHLATVPRYVPGRARGAVAVELASNESPLGPSPAVAAALAASATTLARYPLDGAPSLVVALCARHGLDPAGVRATAGSTAAIAMLCRAVQGDVVVSSGTFPMYERAALAAGRRVVTVPRRGWAADLDGLAQAVGPSTGIVFLANPDNPTGAWFPASALRAWLARLPRHAIPVVDEAYVDYAPSGPDALSFTEHPNLVVLRTFSKAHALAALRVGWLATTPELAEVVDRVVEPFHSSGPAVDAALASLGDRGHLAHVVAANADERARLALALRGLGLEPAPSAANFLFVRVPPPGRALADALLARGVAVRALDGWGHPGGLRVTVGTPEQNARLLAALEDALPGHRRAAAAAPVRDALREATAAVEAGTEGAPAALEVLDAAAEGDGPEARLGRLFAGALRARLLGGDASTGNLYAGEAGPAEMLSAFDALVHATPLVRFSHAAADQALLDAVGDAEALCVVDLGLGGGAQWDAFLDLLVDRGRGGLRVRLVGVDLPAPGPDPAAGLRAAGDRLAAHARALGVPFRFEALPGRIEDVPLPAREAGERLAINAAFALHHTACADAVREARHSRDAVLARLAAAEPDVLVLVEPEGDHNSPVLAERVDAAFRHYGLAFAVLDRCLSGAPGPRRTIEGAFFGREIHNVVVGDGPARVERHAPLRDWSSRLARAGFRRRPAVPFAASSLPLPVGVRIVSGERLEVDGEALLNVTAWSLG